jgi:outer membrane lipoprotein SlyB
MMGYRLSKEREMPNEPQLDTAPPKDLRGRPVVAEDGLNLDPISGEPGAHPVGTGVGASGGALAGAAIGTVGGPIGVAAGAIVGAVAGGLVGKEVAEAIDPTTGGRPEQHQMGTGIGGSAGALGGAAIGSVIAGPIGLAAGAVIGATAGVLAGEGAAEALNPDPTDRPEDHNLATGVGAGAGATAGAVVGSAAGPIGAAAGAVIGSVAGGMAGAGVARAVNPEVEDTYWRASYVSAPYYLPERTYDDYGPAYKLGYDSWSRYGGTFAECEERLSREWDSVKGQSHLTWNEAKHAARAAWDRVDRPIPVGAERR